MDGCQNSLTHSLNTSDIDGGPPTKAFPELRQVSSALRQHRDDEKRDNRSKQQMSKILIVDDELNMRRILKANLRTDTQTCIEASCASEAISLLSREDFDVVVTDHKMPGWTGLDVLRAVQDSDPTASVIFLTAVGTVELAVESKLRGFQADICPNSWTKMSEILSKAPSI
jgi:DNA-binding NtrC family response regulator